MFKAINQNFSCNLIILPNLTISLHSFPSQCMMLIQSVSFILFVMLYQKALTGKFLMNGLDSRHTVKAGVLEDSTKSIVNIIFLPFCTSRKSHPSVSNFWGCPIQDKHLLTSKLGQERDNWLTLPVGRHRHWTQTYSSFVDCLMIVIIDLIIVRRMNVLVSTTSDISPR